MTATLRERLAAKTVRDGDCLRFTGCHNSRGYGVISDRGARKLAHRVAYELSVGPIPDGLTIDHVATRGCRFKDCVEPAHLEPVTNQVNQSRSKRATKTECVAGHEYTPENTIIKKRQSGGTIRNCRACANQAQREARVRASLRDLAPVVDFPVAAPESDQVAS